uniref:Putative ovule protein n=1 Tax=Solanum chacoense TaxID=4108 RepID=A0A0V0HEQ3_SOLCH
MMHHFLVSRLSQLLYLTLFLFEKVRILLLEQYDKCSECCTGEQKHSFFYQKCGPLAFTILKGIL